MSSTINWKKKSKLIRQQVTILTSLLQVTCLNIHSQQHKDTNPRSLERKKGIPTKYQVGKRNRVLPLPWTCEQYQINKLKQKTKLRITVFKSRIGYWVGKSAGKQTFSLPNLKSSYLPKWSEEFQFSALIDYFLYVSSHCRGSKGVGIKEMTSKLSTKGPFQAEKKNICKMWGQRVQQSSKNSLVRQHTNDPTTFSLSFALMFSSPSLSYPA